MRSAAVIQMCSGADVEENLRRAKRLLRGARDAGASLAVLPENFACMPERSSDRRRAAEKDGQGRIQSFLATMASDLGLWIVGGTIPLVAGGHRVAAAVLVFDAAGKRVARYDKMHLFDVTVPGGGERYRESRDFQAGSRLVAVDSPLGRLGLAVCYDLRFPEFFRALSLDGGCVVFAVPSAFTQSTGRAHWDLLVRARAVENESFMLAAAQSGTHPLGRKTYGHSVIVGPWGEVLGRLPRRPGVVAARLDFEAQRRLRRNFPVLAHARRLKRTRGRVI